MELLFFFALCLVPPLAGFATDKPNVVFILGDDQGYGDLACHGNPWIKTANLDRLHAQSVRLTGFRVDTICTISPTDVRISRW